MSQNTPDTTSKSALLAWVKDPARSGAELASATGFFPEADRLIAACVDCPPDVLATLSHSSDKATRAKVTANANTPSTDYVRLGQQFPKEFIANLRVNIPANEKTKRSFCSALYKTMS